ncbi:hypothetical protein SDC9_116441 [bioreactor metagenome]|uniref:Uncharacterized protein n=1 Tax=bioreactor metagenome TaxID=1076179 RepID=A0A645BVH7_9ZZZZ
MIRFVVVVDVGCEAVGHLHMNIVINVVAHKAKFSFPFTFAGIVHVMNSFVHYISCLLNGGNRKSPHGHIHSV